MFKSPKHVVVAAASALIVGLCSAQAYAVTMRPVLQDSDVQKIVTAAKKAIAENHTKGCIAVADADGLLLYMQREVGAPANCLSAATGKVVTAAKFQTPSEKFWKGLMDKNPMMLAVPEMTPLPGGLPLKAKGTVIGAVAISTPDPKIDIKVAKVAAAALQ